MAAWADGGPRDEHDGGDAAAQPGQRVEQHGVPPHVDAGQPGRLGVAADGDGAPAEGGAVEQHPARPPRRPRGCRPAAGCRAPLVVAMLLISSTVTSWVCLSEIAWARPRAATSIASVAMNGTSRPYAMSTPLTRPAPIPTSSAVMIMPTARSLGRQRRRPHRRQRDERADRQVDAAADDHEGHADRDHADDRRAQQDVDDVVGGEELPVGRDHADDPEDDQDTDEAEVAHLGEPAQGPGRLARGAGRGSRLLDAGVFVDRRNLDAGPAGRGDRRRPASRRLGFGGRLRRPVGSVAHATAPSITRSSTLVSSISLAAPLWTTRPSRMTSTRSASPSTSGISLDTSSTPTPESASWRTTW